MHAVVILKELQTGKMITQKKKFRESLFVFKITEIRGRNKQTKQKTLISLYFAHTHAILTMREATSERVKNACKIFCFEWFGLRQIVR